MHERPNDGRGNACQSTAERFDRYGLSPEQVETESLNVPGKRIEKGDVRLSRSSFGDRMIDLKPETIDDVKQWIGNEDEQARDCCCDHEKAPNVAGSAAAADRLADLTRSDIRAQLKRVAKEYVYRDSRPLQVWKPYLDELIVQMPPITLIPFDDIVVESGSTLHVSKHVDVLFAGDVRIEEGGTIVSDGDLKIDCLDIEGRV